MSWCQPSASAPLTSTRLFLLSQLSSLSTCSRFSTASRLACSSGPVRDLISLASAHCLSSVSGGRKQVIQLTVVPPPSVRPAITAIPPSTLARSPRLANNLLKPESSSASNGYSRSESPASSTTTLYPASASRAAITPPPAPEPTTQTSASSSVSS